MSEPASIARAATRADLSALLDMMRAFYAEDRILFDAARVAAGAGSLIDDPSWGTILLLGAGGADGYLVLTRGFSLEHGGQFALLDELYVAPRARGRGMGLAALALARTQTRQWGIARLRLEVNQHNPRAKALYLRAGFLDDQRDILTCDVTATQ